MEKLTRIISWGKETLLSKGYDVKVLPETIQVTPWFSVTKFTISNGYVYLKQTPLTLSLIDWGETVITHPFFSLITFLNTVARHYALKETDKVYLDLQNTCFDSWNNMLSKNDLSAAISLSKQLWPIYAALCFYRLILGSNLTELKIVGRLSGYLKTFNEKNNNVV